MAGIFREMKLDYDKKNVCHVYPINDSARHILKGYFCECNPKVEIQPNKALLVTHMAFDGRHLFEKDSKNKGIKA